MKYSLKLAWKKILDRRKLLLAIATGAATVGCSPSKMMAAKPASLGFSSKTVTATLMSGEQMVRSMAAVTKTEINGTINNEYNARKSLMTGNFEVNSVTSPMMVSVTNLASRFCEALVAKEAGLTAADRRFFNQVDFSKPVGNISDAQFNDVLEKMGMSVLGRKPTPDEMQIMTEGRRDFEDAIPAANKTQSAQTRLLLLFSCSGIMSSFDFITI